eukprot:2029420-Rhodomonas_salina.1
MRVPRRKRSCTGVPGSPSRKFATTSSPSRNTLDPSTSYSTSPAQVTSRKLLGHVAGSGGHGTWSRRACAGSRRSQHRTRRARCLVTSRAAGGGRGRRGDRRERREGEEGEKDQEQKREEREKRGKREGRGREEKGEEKGGEREERGKREGREGKREGIEREA